MPRIVGPERTFTFTIVLCPDCNHSLELASDDEERPDYYTCGGCEAEWTLEGRKIQRYACGEIMP